MHADHSERIISVRAPAGGRAGAPRLSILAPFYKHDPSPLLRALARMAPGPAVEVIILDDGSGAAELLARVLEAGERLTCAVTVIVWGANRGRAKARNRLIQQAHGGHVLFLDADMIPADPGFLDTWLDLIGREHPAAAFGGFAPLAHAVPRSKALHAFVSARSDARPAKERARDPAQFAATSNLLVRRDLLRAIPFDDGFRGWGWEDVDWALRAIERAPIAHIDNPALHAGLDDVETLLRKCREGGANYARLAVKHPHAVRRFRSYHAARALQRLPLIEKARMLLAWLVRDPFGLAPMPARAAAFKLYRASIYAEHLP